MGAAHFKHKNANKFERKRKMTVDNVSTKQKKLPKSKLLKINGVTIIWPLTVKCFNS